MITATSMERLHRQSVTQASNGNGLDVIAGDIVKLLHQYQQIHEASDKALTDLRELLWKLRRKQSQHSSHRSTVNGDVSVHRRISLRSNADGQFLREYAIHNQVRTARTTSPAIVKKKNWFQKMFSCCLKES